MTNAELKKTSKQLYKIFDRLIAVSYSDLEEPLSADLFTKATLAVGNAAALLKEAAKKDSSIKS